jgi:hypothetical protein
MKSMLYCSILILCLSVSGCGTLKCEMALDRAAIGMSKCEIAERLGRPAMVRGILKNNDGDTVEVWEYRVGRGKDFQQVATETAFTALTAGAGAPQLLSSAETPRYWFYFVNGTLAGWGRAGDWQMDKQRICEMKFRPGTNLSQGI